MKNQPSRRLFLAAGSATAVFGALTAAAAGAEASPLAAAISRHRAAYAAFNDACVATDDVVLGREPTDEEWFEYYAASSAEEAELATLAAIPCATDAERRAKVDYVVGHLRRSHGRGWAGSPEEKALEVALNEWLGN